MTLGTRINELRENPSQKTAAALAVEVTRTETADAVKAIEDLYTEDLVAAGWLERELMPRLQNSWTDLEAAAAAADVLSLEAMLRVTDGEMTIDDLCSLIDSWIDPREVPSVRDEGVSSAIAAATNVRSNEIGLRGEDWDMEDIAPLMIEAAQRAYKAAKS